MEDDVYKTVVGEARTVMRERSSKFYAFAYHVESTAQVKEKVDELRKKYFDATHHCFAYRLGRRGESFRINDDGEPSGTAGRPIYGQLLSHDITDCLVVVVRYFGGTKLGVPGLIAAYKGAAAEVLDNADVEWRTVDEEFEIGFPYTAMNAVMRIIKECEPRVSAQNFDNMCSMRLGIRRSSATVLRAKLSAAENVEIKSIERENGGETEV